MIRNTTLLLAIVAALCVGCERRPEGPKGDAMTVTLLSFAAAVAANDQATAQNLTLPQGPMAERVPAIIGASEGSELYRVKQVLAAIDPMVPMEVAASEPSLQGMRLIGHATLKDPVTIGGESRAAGSKVTMITVLVVDGVDWKIVSLEIK